MITGVNQFLERHCKQMKQKTQSDYTKSYLLLYHCILFISDYFHPSIHLYLSKSKQSKCK